MSTVVKDLGPVTAYADAVAAGYTGTKEEWQALMASYASVAEEAQEAKEGAEAAQEAAESARDAAIDAKEGAEDAVDGFGAVVTQATNQAVQTVRAEGTTQVGNVSSEGTTQVNAVQAKGAEVLQSIPADYTELSNDVVQLKQDFTDVAETIGLHINPSASGTTDAISGRQTLISPVELVNGHSYTLTFTLDSASSAVFYFYVDDANNTQITSANIQPGGALTKSKTFTASSNDANAKVTCNSLGQAVGYTATLVDNSAEDDQITQLHAELNGLEVFVGITEPLTFTDNTYINTPSVGTTGNTTQQSLNGCTSLFATCNEGDIFTLTGTPRDNSGSRAYAWLNEDLKCVYRHEDTTVMDGVEIVAPCNGTLIVNFTKANTHVVYKGIRNLHDHIIGNIDDIKKIVNSPIESLPEYVKNDLAYRPLGQLQNPYLCLSCDDGGSALETYTIPMLLDKDVPCTFGLWATKSQVGETPVFNKSEVLRTESGVNAVLSAISNGCEVAQHGPTEWTELSEEKLADFFAREKTAFAELGIEVKGAIYPSHCVNNKTRAITGGIFGSVRSGYRGFKSKADKDNSVPGDVFNPYSYSLTGARSNCYSYTSYNTNDKTLDQLKTALDYAIANNYCMIVYWHDWDLTAAQKTVIEDFIDYAKTTSVTFCTLSEIPTLV